MKTILPGDRQSIRTLIIDDEPGIVKDLELLLSKNHQFISVGSCGSISDAKVLVQATKPDLVLLDIELSDGSCFELLDTLINSH
ncbi:LytR/AlgR family response regulator transcription factor [Chitinophagaceae bacterium MMS25-I14]